MEMDAYNDCHCLLLIKGSKCKCHGCWTLLGTVLLSVCSSIFLIIIMIVMIP